MAEDLRESLVEENLRQEKIQLEQTVERRSSRILDLEEELAKTSQELEVVRQQLNIEQRRAAGLEATIRQMEMDRAPVVTGSLSDYAENLGLSPKRRSRKKK